MPRGSRLDPPVGEGCCRAGAALGGGGGSGLGGPPQGSAAPRSLHPPIPVMVPAGQQLAAPVGKARWRAAALGCRPLFCLPPVA